MNKSEATNVNLLLRWVTGTVPAHWNIPEQRMLAAFEMLAERAYAALGTGMRGKELAERWPKQAPTELLAEVERLASRVAEQEEDSALLAALRAVGVDNWDGYELAFDTLRAWQDEAAG